MVCVLQVFCGPASIVPIRLVYEWSGIGIWIFFLAVESLSLIHWLWVSENSVSFTLVVMIFLLGRVGSVMCNGKSWSTSGLDGTAYIGEGDLHLADQFKCEFLWEILLQTHPEIMCYQLSGHPLAQSHWYYHYQLQCSFPFDFFLKTLAIDFAILSVCRNLSYISVYQNVTHHSRLHSDSISLIKTFQVTPCSNVGFIIWNLLFCWEGLFYHDLYKN